jgi:hypothetical protein
MKPPQKDNVQLAFELMEHVFSRYKNTTEHESNRYPLGDPNRVEHDLLEKDKAHLDLLRAKLDVALMEKLNETIVRSTEASDKLGNKLFWLNVFVAALTLAIAAAAIGELFQ